MVERWLIFLVIYLLYEKRLEKKWGDEIETIVDATDTKGPGQDLLYYIHPRLYYLGEAIKKMANCDTVVFAKGWQYARGCRIEHEVTRLYPFDVFYEGKDIIV